MSGHRKSLQHRLFGSVRRRASADLDAGAAEDLWLLVGLGNPGPRYAPTRHNVGFQLLDELARREGIAVDKLQKKAATGRGHLCGKRVVLAKPLTFMNLSGDSVSALVQFYKVPLKRLLVIYDDLDTDVGAVRFRAKGGTGGHNGMRSISQRLGGKNEFPRLRIGIGRPTSSIPIASYVTQPFTSSEKREVEGAIAEGIQVIETLLSLGVERALSGVRV
ncbi:hypothetical protein WJX81_005049 [Elliptochloris bilobata]|uniref:peptidyl-tRNA hydrolase n=1 Tax=Elliptochloris bilobata TaxID=381761 RepID=A0AAW1S4C8_9CHLO